MPLDADKEETHVVTYVEAFIFFVVFSFILYILYPKDTLYKQVLAEKSNYDLTAIYLENMIRLEPDNKELIDALIKSSMRSSKTDLALKMIHILEKDASEAEKKEFMKYKFEILKTKYFSTNEKEIHNKIIKQMKILLTSVIEDEMYIQDEIKFWYKSSREFSLKSPALYFLMMLVKKEENIQLLEDCYYLSADMKNTKIQAECLKKLRKVDNKWIEQAYYVAINKKNKKQAVLLLKEMAKTSKTWREELAKYYLEIKKYSLSSIEYMKLYKKTPSSKKRKNYFIKALKSLQYGSLLDRASILAKKHEEKYYKDKEVSLFIIKLYLNASRLDDAKRVSIQRLKYME